MTRGTSEVLDKRIIMEVGVVSKAPTRSISSSLFWAIGLSKPIVESRRADSNRLPLLFTSDRSGVAGVCTGMQMPHI